MDIQEYISSGILELYAAGALPEGEAAEVAEMVQRHPEVKAELAEIYNTLDQYASWHAVTPPAHLREKILSSFADKSTFQNPESSEIAAALSPLTENPAPAEEAVIRPFRPAPDLDQAATPSFFNAKWLAAAAVILLVLSNALSVYFYQNWKATERSLVVAMSSQDQYAQTVNQLKDQVAAQDERVALLQDENTKRVALAGVGAHHEAKATVFWHQETKKVLMDAGTLPPPPAGQQYQLWALVDSKPVNAGLIPIGTDSAGSNSEALQAMERVTGAQAFAVTLEPVGGSAAPTLDQMFVMGKI